MSMATEPVNRLDSDDVAALVAVLPQTQLRQLDLGGMLRKLSMRQRIFFLLTGAHCGSYMIDSSIQPMTWTHSALARLRTCCFRRN